MDPVVTRVDLCWRRPYAGALMGCTLQQSIFNSPYWPRTINEQGLFEQAS
jgi:hypothetical protein